MEILLREIRSKPTRTERADLVSLRYLRDDRSLRIARPIVDRLLFQRVRRADAVQALDELHVRLAVK